MCTRSARGPFGLLLASTLLAACAGPRPAPVAVLPQGGVCAPRSYWPTREWRKLPPATIGVDTAELALADAYVRDSMPNLYSLLVVQYGYVVAEHYWHGAADTTHFEVRSVTKSVTSAAVGQAIDEGVFRGVDQRISDFFPEYFHTQDPASWKRRIAIKHLLTMTSGIQWGEGEGIALPAGVADTTFIALPMSDRPGEHFNYNSGSIHLLSIAVKRASGKSLRVFANTTIFAPIGVEVTPEHWDEDPAGNNFGGYGLRLTAREMARFGFLYLNDGCWDGARVLAPGWVEAATGPEEDTPWGSGTYGYLWWRTTFDGHQAYFAGGWGGQHIIVVPSLDLVVVTAATPTATTVATDPMNLVRRFVVPAAEEAGGE
jgi:CubicO group peptidase (beta-lactamase class C family)